MYGRLTPYPKRKPRKKAPNHLERNISRSLKPRLWWILAKKQLFLELETKSQKKNTTKMTMNLWNQFRFHQIWKYVTWNHFWFHKNWLTFILRLVIRFWWLKLARLKIADNNRQQFWDAFVFLRWAKITQTGWKIWQNAPKVTLSRMCLKPTIWLKSIHLSFEK